MPTLDAAIDARKAKQGANEFASATNKIKRNAGDADKSVKKTDRALGGLGSQIGKVAVGMIGLGAAYKGLRIAVSSVKEFTAFELGLANVSTMLNDQSMRYLPNYNKQISNLAIKYGQATGTLTKGLYDILSASVDASKAVSLLEISSQAAIGGMTDTGIAADALTTVLNSYSLSAEDAGYVSDILFTIVKRGKLTFGELAGSIGKVAALAASTGLSLEEVGAALATMTRSGLSSDIAVTSLKAILTTFLSPTDEAKIAVKDLGFELNTATLRAIGLTGVVQRLSKATVEQRSAIFPNVRAITGLSTIVQNTASNMQDLGEMTDAAGARMIAFGKIANTTAQELAKTKEMWAEIKRDFGEALVPVVSDWVTGLRILKDNWDANVIAIMRYRTAVKLMKGNDLTIDQARILIDTSDVANQIKSVTKAFEDMYAEIEARQTTTIINPLHWSVIEEQEEAIKKAANAFPQLTEAQINAGKSMTDLFAAINAEKDLLKLTDDERERAIELIKFEATAKIASTDNAEQLVAMYEGELKSLQNVRKEKEAAATVKSLFNELKAEKELIGLTNDERERAVVLIELEAAAKLSNANSSDATVQAYKDELQAMSDLRREAEEMQKYSIAIEESMAGAIRSPLTALLDNTRDIGEVLKAELTNLATDILSLMYEDVITKPLMGAIKDSVQPAMNEILNSITSMLSSIVSGAASGIGSLVSMGVSAAFGGMSSEASYQGGWTGAKGLTMKRCAKGDILSGPTVYPMSNGGLALGGEAGEEGLFPLGRDSQGRLGVRAAGDNSNSEPQAIKIINVMDQSQVQEYVDSADGERQIVNIMQRNSHLIT